MSESEWKAVFRSHNRHVDAKIAEKLTPMSVINVTNRGTQREQRVIMCRAFCPECRSYMQALIWRESSPLNRLQEKMPLIADGDKAPPPS